MIRQDEQTTAMQTIVFELCSLDSGTYNWYTQCLVLLRAILRRADFSFTSHLLYALLAGTEWCFCQKLTRLNWSNIVRLKRYLASFQACQENFQMESTYTKLLRNLFWTQILHWEKSILSTLNLTCPGQEARNDNEILLILVQIICE